jgi:hypothetical protein
MDLKLALVRPRQNTGPICKPYSYPLSTHAPAWFAFRLGNPKRPDPPYLRSLLKIRF